LKNLFEPTSVKEVKQRIAQLRAILMYKHVDHHLRQFGA
jgi:hypothetical protein